MGFEESHVAFKEPSFWQSGQRVSAPNSSVMHFQKVLDGDQVTFLLWAPDFLAIQQQMTVRGNTAICSCRGNSKRHMDFGITQSFLLFWKMNQIKSWTFFLCKMLQFLQKQEIWKYSANNLADLSYRFSYLLVDDLVSSYGQQLCFPVVTVVQLGKVQGLELCLDM